MTWWSTIRRSNPPLSLAVPLSRFPSRFGGGSVLLTIAVLLFVGFLVSPGFVDSIKGDGTVTMLPGFATVIWLALVAPSAVAYSPREALFILPVLFASAAFIVLPLLVALSCFRSRVLRHTFCGAFICGLFSMAWMILSSERFAFGVYLWLLAVLAAGGFCLFKRS